MRKDYKEAKKLADEAVRKAERDGVSPYLPVLDAIDGAKKSAAQKNLGIMELPIDRICGNKEQARNNSFANNFMPLLEDDSEFALKWSALYDSYVQEGIRDAIKVYEYMNRYYVQEGNKRVSVSKYGGTEFILADVTRIIPQKDNSRESKLYFEYLDFYKVTKNYLLVFTAPGFYRILADLLGQDLEHEWPEELCADLKSAYFRFSKCLKKKLKIEDSFKVSDAFLTYIAIFPMQTLLETTDDQIIQNIEMAKKNLQMSGDVESVLFLNEAPEAEKESGFRSLFPREKKYTASSPLKTAFIYDLEIEKSRWIDSHEAGRLYVDGVIGDKVVTNHYLATNGVSVKDAIQQAVDDGNELVFAVSPFMLQDVLAASVQYPNVRFLDCTGGYSVASVRCYQGKIYEADFLAGILAADILLRENTGKPRRIGYLSRHFGSRKPLVLNAFAIGVSLIDPECRISVKNIKPDDDTDYRKEWEEEGITIYADIEFATVSQSSGRLGVYRMEEDKDVFLGVPYLSWGRFYAQVIQSVLNGAWDISMMKSNFKDSLTRNNSVTNYSFGLSTGVVGLRTKDIPYQTRKLLSFFEKAITSGSITPFSGEIRAQGGVLIQEDTDDVDI